MISGLESNLECRSTYDGRVGAAASGHPLATNAAVATLAAGGNAVDAAIAAAYVLMVALPEACGIGGDAMALVASGKGDVTSLNGAGLSPAGFAGELGTDGASTTSTPGAVAALDRMGTLYGALPRRDNLAAAVTLARDGFALSEALLAAQRRHRSRLRRGSASSELARDDLRIGDVLRFPALADTIEAIASEGPSAFYSGPVAAAIETTVRSEGGALSVADLEAHGTLETPAISKVVAGAVVYAPPPPSQAILALLALAALESVEPTAPPVRAHAAIEAIEAAFQYRAAIGMAGVAQHLLDQTLEVDLSRAQHRNGPTLPTHTTTVATADSGGMVVSMTISVYDEFGCATLVKEHGILLNDRMLGFDRDPESPNVARPSARPVNTLSPLLIDQRDRRFALCTPGADGQVQTTTQILDAVLRGGLGLPDAIDRPRWRSANGEVAVETGLPSDVLAHLKSLGHRLSLLPYLDRTFGAAVAAGANKTDGSTFSFADRRRDASAGAL
jgi:gamma-glutamyltranspeptidase/glutathione hydrolase